MDGQTPAMNPNPINQLIEQAHDLYCQQTGQQIRMRMDRERMWYELIRIGFTLQDIKRVITYLQREIREGRRNVGALKISNLTQPGRFEEDLAISRVQLRAPTSPPLTKTTMPKPAPDKLEQDRQRSLQLIQDLKKSFG